MWPRALLAMSLTPAETFILWTIETLQRDKSGSGSQSYLFNKSKYLGSIYTPYFNFENVLHHVAVIIFHLRNLQYIIQKTTGKKFNKHLEKNSANKMFKTKKWINHIQLWDNSLEIYSNGWTAIVGITNQWPEHGNIQECNLTVGWSFKNNWKNKTRCAKKNCAKKNLGKS